MHRARLLIGLCGGVDQICSLLSNYGLNEYGEIIMQHFASYDDHRWLEIVLSLL